MHKVASNSAKQPAKPSQKMNQKTRGRKAERGDPNSESRSTAGVGSSNLKEQKSSKSEKTPKILPSSGIPISKQIPDKSANSNQTFDKNAGPNAVLEGSRNPKSRRNRQRQATQAQKIPNAVERGGEEKSEMGNGVTISRLDHGIYTSASLPNDRPEGNPYDDAINSVDTQNPLSLSKVIEKVASITQDAKKGVSQSTDEQTHKGSSGSVVVKEERSASRKLHSDQAGLSPKSQGKNQRQRASRTKDQSSQKSVQERVAQYDNSLKQNARAKQRSEALRKMSSEELQKQFDALKVRSNNFLLPDSELKCISDFIL